MAVSVGASITNLPAAMPFSARAGMAKSTAAMKAAPNSFPVILAPRLFADVGIIQPEHCREANGLIYTPARFRGFHNEARKICGNSCAGDIRRRDRGGAWCNAV